MRGFRGHLSLVVSAALLAGGGGWALGQTAPDAPATQPDAAATTKPTVFAFHFDNAPIDEVLNYLSKVAGLTVVKAQPYTGRVSIIRADLVDANKAIEILNTALRIDGYAAVRQGDNLTVDTWDNVKKMYPGFQRGRSEADSGDGRAAHAGGSGEDAGRGSAAAGIDTAD
jgi:hypothetical protein